MILASILALQAATSSPASTIAYHDGNDLLNFCTAANRDACSGYLEAVAEVMGSGYAIYQRRMCIPPRAPLSQLHDVVVNYLVKRPELRSGTASDLIANAYAEAFPCQQH